MRKLKDNRGETLIESLVSVLVAAFAFSLLATCVVTATKINAKTKTTDVSFKYTDESPIMNSEIKLNGSGLTPKHSEETVSLYENNGYYYYFRKTGGDTP